MNNTLLFTLVFLDHEGYDSWTTLTTLELEGSIWIWLLNYEWSGYTLSTDSRGYRYNRSGVDAIRLQCGQAIVPIATIDAYHAAVNGRANGEVVGRNIYDEQYTSFVACRLHSVTNAPSANQFTGQLRLRR